MFKGDKMSLIVFIYSDVNLNASFLNKRIIDSEFLNLYPYLNNIWVNV